VARPCRAVPRPAGRRHDLAVAHSGHSGWRSARHTFLDRGDGIAVHAPLSRIEQAIFSTVLALNRVYEPHRVAKRQRHLLTGLDIAPDDLSARFASLWQGSEPDRIVNAEALLRCSLWSSGTPQPSLAISASDSASIDHQPNP
jgi:hypothetical protein